MSDEKLSSMECLREAVDQALFHVKILEYAAGNIEAVRAGSETETLAFYSTYERVVAVWMDGDHLIMRWVKKSSKGAVASINAIPVQNESEARRWAALLNSPATDTIPADCSLRLAAVDGASVDDS